MQLMKEKLVFRDIKLRSDKDFRPDHFVKKDMLDQFRAEGWNPTLVFDDRSSVVQMWREMVFERFKSHQETFNR